MWVLPAEGSTGPRGCVTLSSPCRTGVNPASLEPPSWTFFLSLFSLSALGTTEDQRGKVNSRDTQQRREEGVEFWPRQLGHTQGVLPWFSFLRIRKVTPRRDRRPCVLWPQPPCPYLELLPFSSIMLPPATLAFLSPECSKCGLDPCSSFGLNNPRAGSKCVRRPAKADGLSKIFFQKINITKKLSWEKPERGFPYIHVII